MATHQRLAAPNDTVQFQSAQQRIPLPQICSFFRLSAELRNIIYAEVVESEDALWVAASRRNRLVDGTPAPHAALPALAQVCQQIRSEALPMFYGNNNFSITLMREENVIQAKRWFRLSGEAGLQHTRHIRLHGYLKTGFAGWHGPAACWIDVERMLDGSVNVSNANERVVSSDQIRKHPGPVEAISACVRATLANHTTLSRHEDFSAIVDMFAWHLHF